MSARLGKNDVSVLITWNFSNSIEMSIVIDSNEKINPIPNWTLTVSVLAWFKSIEMLLMNAKYCS
jgi:hypothetical protein